MISGLNLSYHNRIGHVALPPEDHELVSVFLRDKDFLVFSPSSYNTLGLGTSQLYNKTLVYNHKRHGLFSFGNRQFDFRVKPRFPQTLTPEFLLVDVINNLDELAEDKNVVLRMAAQKLSMFDQGRLTHAVVEYGGRKWWSSGIGHPHCKVVIFMGLTDPTAEKHRQHRWF